MTDLSAAKNDGIGVVFNTRGAGAGRRDIDPEVVTSFREKIIPGIMEAIRLKSGTQKPNALLSRLVAGVSDRIAVPGLSSSVGAVAEQMAEIEKTLEHLLLMLHGLDTH